MTPEEKTVGDLINLLSACGPNAPVCQAVNPYFPMAHRLAQVLQSVDETGRTFVYLAEGRDPDAAQLGHLPPEAAIELTWQGPVQAPQRRPRRRVGGN
ncbi:hypothetical protein AB0D74_21340 [Streptomyces sp. NPDC048278]|uniref:hypothetical protein n=1 Tax=Streptomyces sp. NPDC048278 TaxID=3155809 RepID=UPI00342DC8A1